MPSTKPKFTVRFESKAELSRVKRAAKFRDVSVNKYLRRKALEQAEIDLTAYYQQAATPVDN